LCNLPYDEVSLIFSEFASQLKEILKVATVAVLHEHVEGAVYFLNIVQFDYVLALNTLEEIDLAFETFLHLFV
jgi:hypothetical protein